MRKNLILAVSSVLLVTSISQASGYKALSTYHMMEAVRTGDLNHLNQGMIYNNFDRMEEQRRQQYEESRRQEERRYQERQEEQRREEVKRLEAQRRATEVKAAEVQREQEQVRQELQQERQQVQKYEEQIAKAPRRFSDPVQEAKKKGGTFFWDEGVCKQKLPNGKIEVMSGSAVAIRLCRGKGGPDDIDAAYEQYYLRQITQLNKKFAYVDDKTLSQAESCLMWAPTETHLAFDVKCNDKVVLRLFVKSPRLDTPEAKAALETIVEKLSYSSLQTKETSMQSGRGILFTK